MLFVLRLLPSYKVWQQRVVVAIFLFNFLVTLESGIAFGISCIPFRANWDEVPNSKCLPVDILVITNQVNASKSHLLVLIVEIVF